MASPPVAPPLPGAIFSSGSFKEGRRLLEKGTYGEAATRFAAGVSGRKDMYTVQLALACEPSTIARAGGSTRGSSQFFILETSFKGQACFRLLWGIYPSKDAAAAARAGVPSSFLKDPHPPVIAPL
jgi:septal ring-binding cell division protein DamX